jgi:zinc transporter 2
MINVSQTEDSKFIREHKDVNMKVASKITKVAIFCGTFMVIEFIGGYLAGSLAIMSDAAHLMSDLCGFIISIVSLKIATKPSNYELTFGYHRYEVIGALSSILIIWGLTVWLLVEAAHRFFNPGQIQGLTMVTIACCGLLFNLILAKILASEDLPNAFEKEEEEELITHLTEEQQSIYHNELEKIKDKEDEKEDSPVLKAAIVHIIGDMLQSLGVVIASLIIYFFQDSTPNIVYVDPVCTILFAIIVMFTTVPVSRDCLNVLMEATPKNVSIKGLLDDLKRIPNIVDIHDIHVWCISVGKTAISLHILSNTPQKTLEEATSICRIHRIFHETIQVEDNTQRRRPSFLKWRPQRSPLIYCERPTRIFQRLRAWFFVPMTSIS